MINRFGDTSGSNYVWGRQFEKGSSVTDYYATTGTIKNRGTTWTDLSGRGNTGTLTNGPNFNSSNSGSIVFDGVDDYVDLGISPILENTLNGTVNWSICYWVKYTQNGRILDLGELGGDPTGALELNVDSISVNNTTVNSSMTTPIISTNWNYIALIKNTSRLHSWYLNGLFSNSDTGTADYTVGSRIWKIGRRAFNNASNFGGNLSQMQIYNRALTATEVQQNFNATRSRFGI
jgi:hypothetical protein